jgi:hypothetical protein
VVEGLADDALAGVVPAPRHVQRIGPGRAALEFAPELDAAAIIQAVTASRATLVSLAPVRDSLEDFFMQQVAGADWDRMGKG